MSVRDHSLDEKIVEAATAEFLACGFRGASMRHIAQRAGLTTGALYNRYQNKDVLFCSLLQPVLAEIGGEFEPMRSLYQEIWEAPDPEKLMAAIRQEEQVYLDLMFRHYEECVLFFCRSDGSSVRQSLDRMMEEKAVQTVSFLKSIAKREVDLDGIAMILSEQFHYYRHVLQKGYSREKAAVCMKTVEEFMEAGWRDLFEKIL